MSRRLRARGAWCWSWRLLPLPSRPAGARRPSRCTRPAPRPTASGCSTPGRVQRHPARLVARLHVHPGRGQQRAERRGPRRAARPGLRADRARRTPAAAPAGRSREGVRAGIEAVGIAEERHRRRRGPPGLRLGQQPRRPDHPDPGRAPARPGRRRRAAVRRARPGPTATSTSRWTSPSAVKQFFYPKLRLRGFASRAARAGQRRRRHAGDPRPARRPGDAGGAPAAGCSALAALVRRVGRRPRRPTASGTASAVGRGHRVAADRPELRHGGPLRHRAAGRGQPVDQHRHRLPQPRDPGRRRAVHRFGFGEGLLSVVRAVRADATASGCRRTPKPGAPRPRLGNPTGDLSDPTVTMHTVYDPLVIVQNERLFTQRVARHGDAGPLLQLYVQPPRLHDGSALRCRPLQLRHRPVRRCRRARSTDGCPRATAPDRQPAQRSCSARIPARSTSPTSRPCGRLDKEHTTCDAPPSAARSWPSSPSS